MEKLDLAVLPTAYVVNALVLDWKNASIEIRLEDDTGGSFSHFITGVNATNLMIALNKIDLTAKSLHRRIMEKLVADGVVAGTISGTPD